MKRYFYLLGLSAGLALTPAHAITENYDFLGLALGLPDGDPTGVANLQTISSSIVSIDDISVSLDIAGTWNGDIYASLQHDTGFAVLLNRIGRTSGDSFGSSDDGFSVTLNDLGGFPDIHGQTSGGGTLFGNFGSDGRDVDPNLVLDVDARTALLTDFVGMDANGGWTLFVADMSGGDTHVLNSWSMEISGSAVPTPVGGSSALMFGLALSGIAGIRRINRTLSAS